MQNVKIPQNVQVEDKLIGPLSLKQLILVGIGGGFSYTLFAAINKSVGYVPLTAHMVIWLPAIFSAAFALVRINDISLFRYCLLTIEMLSKPRRRVWQPRQGIILNIQTRPIASQKAKEGAAASLRPKVEKTSLKLEELTSLLDQEGKSTAPLEGVTAEPLALNVDSIRHQAS